ncbi:unnamed protein product [Lymnaea stagnalis]|uniref:Laccase n=1 Tax=Lymnaea stagnalis TaxID=6523 RepID=A0AAV2IJF4_LYMST
MNAVERFTVLFAVLFIAVLCVSHAQSDIWNYEMRDYKDHPCLRPCEDGGPVRVCKYEWIVENYYVLSKACHGCPYNLSHCSMPHCIAADGFGRGIKVANRMMPGPGIQVCEGDTIEVTVDNRLESSEGTSIHWHGILQHDTQYMDGVAMVTQCPIPFNAKFTYRFLASSHGTHFWHGHAGTQRADGLYGPLVIRRPPGREHQLSLYDYDLPEHVIDVTDWTIDMTTNRLAKYVHFDYDNKPELMLINGKGQHQAFRNDTANTTHYTPRSDFSVTPGKKYRFRVICSAIMNCPIQFSIDDHTMTIISSDGNDIEPFVTDSFTIYGGERLDFVLFADKDAALRNYWIRVRGYNNCANRKASQTAILKYFGAPDELPPGPTRWEDGIRAGIHLNPAFPIPPNDTVEFKDMKAVDPDDDTLTSPPNRTIYLAIDFVPIDNLRSHNLAYYPFKASNKFYSPQVNWISSQMPPSPPLSQYDDVPQDLYCNAETVQKQCTKEWCACVHMYEVALGDLVELVVVDEGKPSHAYHPLHLHGHRFRVMGMGKLGESTSIKTVKEMDKRGELNRTISKAVLKDTVIIPDGGYTIIRFRADNPGIWLFHCHVEFHSETGMSVLFQVGAKSQLPRRPKNFPKCGNWKFEGYEDDLVVNPPSQGSNSSVATPEVPKVEVTCLYKNGAGEVNGFKLWIFAFTCCLLIYLNL